MKRRSIEFHKFKLGLTELELPAQRQEDGRMTGTLKSLVQGKGFGFIVNERGKEYFMHKTEFHGHWDDLVSDYNNDEIIKVEFEVSESPKGPRAVNVRRTEAPNEGT